MALSIFVPIGYITVLVASLSIFSRIYRKRTAQALVREHGQSWFVEGHPERDIYQTLVQAAAGGGGGGDSGSGSAASVPDVVLKAALLNRAMADVRRILRMRDDKQALSVLVQKGSVGDDLVGRLALAEKELEAEILDVVSEANTFREGWGQIIFPTASEMVAHLKHKEAYYAIPAQRDEEAKRMKEAGLEIPKPTIEVPSLTTPAGTSITIGAPPGAAPQQPVVAGPVPPPGMQQISNGAQKAKSGTVADAGDDELQLRFYKSIGNVTWDLDSTSKNQKYFEKTGLGKSGPILARGPVGQRQQQMTFVDKTELSDDAESKPQGKRKGRDGHPDSGDDGEDADENGEQADGKPQRDSTHDILAAQGTAGKKKKHKKKAKKPLVQSASG